VAAMRVSKHVRDRQCEGMRRTHERPHKTPSDRRSNVKDVRPQGCTTSRTTFEAPVAYGYPGRSSVRT
jgi:hypothetical protein